MTLQQEIYVRDRSGQVYLRSTSETLVLGQGWTWGLGMGRSLLLADTLRTGWVRHRPRNPSRHCSRWSSPFVFV